VGWGNELTLDDLPPEFRESKPLTVSEQLSPPKHQKYQNKADIFWEALQMTGGNLEASSELCGHEPRNILAQAKKNITLIRNRLGS
jgi:hypothetical protein